ncbi:MAG TPA: acetyl-CoA carboxylase biotin carboxyl carrier protein subunit [Thermoanaerobaculaceae bacterium]|nr:acetyl-CoA carboxylase biotin carboxyl carrier protein subunit [Thermoanaerobaculaceae bacterium]
MSDEPDLKTLVVDGTAYQTRYTRKFALRKGYAAPDPSQIRAHIPGVIVAVHVRRGQRVARGDALLVLEAMKMKNDLTAAHEGTVREIHVEEGQMVAKSQLLLELS